MRLINRPLGFILAAALLAASIILIVEVIAFAAHTGPLLVHWTTWYQWAARKPTGTGRWSGCGRPS